MTKTPSILVFNYVDAQHYCQLNFGCFTISFSHRFATDAYLDAFLYELRALGLTPEVADRHPLRLAPIADYRNAGSNTFLSHQADVTSNPVS